MVWYPIHDQSGVQYVPHTWAGVFVLLVARFLFPSINIALVDTDCVPVSLFEVEDLILLSKLQMSAHSTRTPPGGISASDQPKPVMLLFSEQFHDINAGLVVSIGDPNADVLDLSMPVEELERVLIASRDALLASSVPSQPPTTMLRQGTLLTPFLGIQCKTPLDLCWVWALQGLLLARLFWPIPQNWTVGDQWPRRAHDLLLKPEARSRIPCHTDWARGTFEQGALFLSCQSFQQTCPPWFCRAQSYFRRIELTHPSCVLQCFIALFEINQEPKAHYESWLQKVGKPSLLSCSVSETFVHFGSKQAGHRSGECVGTALPQLPLSVHPCGNTCLSFGSPIASSTSLNGCYLTRSLLFICRSFRRGNPPLLTTPQGNHWVLLAMPCCPSLNPMPPTRQGDHWVFLALVRHPYQFQAHYCNLLVSLQSLRKQEKRRDSCLC